MWWSYGFVILSLLVKEAVGGELGWMQYLWARQWQGAMGWPKEATYLSIIPNYVEYYPMPILRDRIKDLTLFANPPGKSQSTTPHGLGWYFIFPNNIFIEVHPEIVHEQNLKLSFHIPTDEDLESVREAFRAKTPPAQILYPSCRGKNMPFNVFVPYKSEPRFLSDREPRENWLKNHYIPAYTWLHDHVKELQWWMLQEVENLAIIAKDPPAYEHEEVIAEDKQFGITTTVYKKSCQKLYTIKPILVGDKTKMEFKETELSHIERNIAKLHIPQARVDGYFIVVKSNHGEFLGSERCTYWNPKPLQYKPIPKLPSPSDPVTSKRSSRSPTSRENRQLAASELGTGQ